jgi:hypothetical protein
VRSRQYSINHKSLVKAAKSERVSDILCELLFCIISTLHCIRKTDGLYVLLKPPKGKNNQLNDQPRVPSAFIDWVMMKSPKKNCPWSLSGPQFPQPTAIQQRYCYPKGDPSYSSQKGGALWTIVSYKIKCYRFIDIILRIASNSFIAVFFYANHCRIL